MDRRAPLPALLPALLLVVSLSGCVDSDASSCGGADVAGGAPGHDVAVYLGNERQQPACMEVRLDGQVVVLQRLAAAEPSGEYGLARSLEWPDATVTVRASDGDVVEEETVDLSQNGHLVVVRDGGGIRIDAFQEEPVFL